MNPENPYSWIEKSLSAIHRANWYRSPQTIESLPGPLVQVEGRELINFASNDYLGLAGDDRLIQAAIKATQTYGTGATGSRLITGNRPLHQQLEAAIADWKKTEAAIVFSSGYLANIGAIAALVGQRDLILGDRYNHSCLKNGAILSGATFKEYSHNQIEELKTLLEQHRHQHRRCLILSDTVFSMDGDICQLPELLNLAAKFDCMVLVDEAHGTGVLGETGSGAVEHFGCTGKPLIQMGTLSKALGSLGGYIAGSASLIDFLRNRAPSWIYTTGLSPGDTAAALEAIAIIRAEPERRQKLWQNIAYLQQEFATKLPSCWKILPSQSPIFALQMSDAAAVLAAGSELKAAGIWAAAVRPPTVPTSRIRITVMATHELEHCQFLVNVLSQFGNH